MMKQRQSLKLVSLFSLLEYLPKKRRPQRPQQFSTFFRTSGRDHGNFNYEVVFHTFFSSNIFIATCVQKFLLFDDDAHSVKAPRFLDPPKIFTEMLVIDTAKSAQTQSFRQIDRHIAVVFFYIPIITW